MLNAMIIRRIRFATGERYPRRLTAMKHDKRMMKLGLFLFYTGHHIAAWRHEDGEPDGAINVDRVIKIARLAEEAKFDMVFLEDGVAIRELDLAIASRTPRATYFEPLTLLSALAVSTSKIGLVATVSTTYNEPYTTARKFASLDLISGGRAGWNLVTSSTDAEARNFDRADQDLHGDRYERANEFIDVVDGLWASWANDALVLDRENARFFAEDGVRLLNHSGKYYKVRGPLNVSRSPQGRPIRVQAGSSEDGKRLAARTADVVFTAQQTSDEARAFYADLKGRLAAHGREPDDVKIMPGIMPIVGDSEALARERFEELQSLVPIEIAVSVLAKSLGFPDIVNYPVDGPLPDNIPETNGNKSRQQLMISQARRGNLSIREMALRASASRGHSQIFGTAKEIVDQLEERFSTRGCDGFNVLLPMLPRDLHQFNETIVPELQRRGLFRTEYEGSTLRQNLGLRPDENWSVRST
jgi:FMN-dependent oxidoreductase (nitrilotriacetate monooxygenase family)